MEWNDMKEQKNKIIKTKYALKDTTTGRYVCDSKGDVKEFVSENDAKLYIISRKLSNNFEICCL